ncbi:MAG: leucine-rich repeat protein [Clostridia bacterium]|nr:leucine-rich repeat protein [Clostridia bacterium]
MNKLNNKSLKILIIFTFALIMCLLLIACTTGPVVIKFNSNGGTECEDITIDSDTTTIELPTPTKTGYDFAGWYYDRSCTDRAESMLSDETIPITSITLYALWERTQYTVIFKAGENVVDTRRYGYGTRIYSRDFPSLDAYIGYSWDDADYTVYDNRTIEARYTDPGEQDDEEVYSLKIYTLNAQGEFVEYKSFSENAGATIEQVDAPSYSGEGDYYFDGWYYDTKYTNPCAEIPATMPKVKDGTKIYAKFKEFTYKLSYFKYKTTSEGVIITGLSPVGSYQSTIEIPSKIEGKNVYAISAEFELYDPTRSVINNAFLKKIVLPKTLKKIGNFAFYRCTQLEQVIFNGDNLTTIGLGAFMGCSNLRSIDIPKNVTNIGAYCFAGLNYDYLNGEISIRGYDYGDYVLADMSLENVNIPRDSILATIGEGAFYNCENLTSITLSAAMNRFDVSSFKNSSISDILFHEGGNFKGINGIVYSSNMKILYYYPKQNTNTTFTFDSSITEVSANAFENVTLLETINFSRELIRIGKEAFKGCSSLKKLELKATRLTNIEEGAFSDCSSITTIELPSTLAILGNNVFMGCSKLETIDYLDTNLNRIPNYAFYGCVSLKSITIPKTVESIGNYAFYNCSSANRLSFMTGTELTRIENNAFNECEKLTETNLPVGLVYIGDYAFACTNKSSFELSSDAATGLVNITHLGNYAFSNTSIKNFTISKNIASNADLGQYLFKGCNNLSRISINRNDTYDTIPKGLLYGCTNLTSISFPLNIRVIEDYAFYNCVNIISATFVRDNNVSVVERIGNYAFYNCSKLSSENGDKEVLPNSLVSLGEYAFANCSNIQKIYIPNTLTTISKFAFSNCTLLSIVEYKTGTQLTTILDGAFNGCTSLQEMVLPSTLKVKSDDDLEGICQMPFKNCTSLTSFRFEQENVNGLYVEDGVVYRRLYDSTETELLTERAIHQFPMAKSTASYTVLNSVSEIDRYAFAASTIVSLALETNSKDHQANVENVMLLKIGDYAFSESLIDTATFNRRLKEIGEYAFYQCPNLTEITFEDTFFTKSTLGYSIINKDKTYSYDDNGISIGEGAFKQLAFTSLSIPATVEYIGKNAFSNQYSLLTVTFAEEQNKDLIIDEGAFEYDIYLTEIVFPRRTVAINSNAFIYCSNIKAITFLGDDEIEIGDNAFANLNVLEKINIPANIISFGVGVFENNTRLKNITFAPAANRTRVEPLEINESLFSGIYALKSITIPSYVSKIGGYAFINTSLSNITIEGGELALDIGEYAFSELKTLKNIDLPKRVNRIEGLAFYKSGLENFTIEENANVYVADFAFGQTKLTEVYLANGAIENTNSLGGYIFSSISTLTTFVAPSLTFVPIGMFEQSNNLVNVRFNGYESIGNNAFEATKVEKLYGIDGIEYQLNNISYIGENAFAYSSLTSLVISDLHNDFEIGEGTFDNCRFLENVEITTTGDITINRNAFDNCISLSTLKLVANQVTFNGSVFYNDVSLGDGITITETDPNYVVDNGVIYTNDHSCLVYYPSALIGATYTIHNDCTQIYECAFYKSAYLSNLIIKNASIVDKEDEAIDEMLEDFAVYVPGDLFLQYQNEWTDVTIKEYSVSDDNFIYTYNSNKSLTISGYLGSDIDITIPSVVEFGDEHTEYPVQRIGNKAFAYNYDITRIDLGNSIKEIGSKAFSNCLNLGEVVFGRGIVNIKSYAFQECVNLTTVTFVDHNCFLEKIEMCAFQDCINLETITLPRYIQVIENSAFNNCINLSNISFGNSIEEIGVNAFYNCRSLISLDLPSSIRKIEKQAFYNDDKLIYVILRSLSVPTIDKDTFAGTVTGFKIFVANEVQGDYKSNITWRNYISQIIPLENICNAVGYEKYVLEKITNGYRLVSYIGGDTDVNVTIHSNISEEINLIEIGEYSIGQFVETLVIGEGVTSIAQRAFVNASRLEEITLASTIKTIGAYAFENLQSLETVNIVNTESNKSQLTTINEKAFYECRSLREIILPESLLQIGNYAFASESEMALEKVVFKHKKSYKERQDNVEVLVNTDASIKSIGLFAFYNCRNVKNMLIYADVESIKEGAFKNCSNLQTLILDSTNVYAQLDNNSNETFSGCNRLFVIVHNTMLAQYTKDWANTVSKTEKSKLTSAELIIGDGLTGYYAYQVMSENNRTVMALAYLGTPILDGNYNYPQNFIKAIENDLIVYENEITVPELIEITNNNNTNSYFVTRIGAAANGSTNIPNGQFIGRETTKVTISPRITEIGEDAFRDCYSLQEVVFTDRDSTGLVISNYAFYGCTDLEKMIIPNTVTEIKDYSFAYCTSLTGLDSKFVIQESISNSQNLIIGKNTFYYCTGLQELYLPRQVASIGQYAFSYCENMNELKFSVYSRLVTIGAYAFSYSGLVTINIPDTVQKVNNYAFSNCKKLNSIYLNRIIMEGVSAVTETERNVFAGLDDRPFIKIFVPADQQATYASKVGWSEKIVIKNQFDDSGKYAYSHDFEGQNAVTITAYVGNESSITIPRTITINGATNVISALGRYFLYDNVESVSFASNSEIIKFNDHAFYGNKKIKSIIFPNTVTELGDNVFYGCSSLEEVTLSNSLVAVASGTFHNCTSLKEIIIPQSVQLIGNEAFSNCTSLTRITINFTTASDNLGQSAFDNVGANYGGNYVIIVPHTVANLFNNQWSSVSSHIVSTANVSGDFVLEAYQDGWALRQYSGKLVDLNLVELTIAGKKIKKLNEHSLIGFDNIKSIIVIAGTIYPDEYYLKITEMQE